MSDATRKPAAVRRREIAVAAMEICGTKGAAALTTASIAHEVGLTTGAIFRHFTTLEDVLRESTRLAIEMMEATFPSEDLEPVDRLFELARARIELLGNDPGTAWLLQSDEARKKLPKDAVKDLMALVARSKKFVLRALKEGAKAGSLRDDIPADDLMVCFMGTIHSLIGMSGIRGGKSRSRNVKMKTVLAGLRLMMQRQ